MDPTTPPPATEGAPRARVLPSSCRSPHSPPPSSHRRCLNATCNRALVSALHDPHTTCVFCRPVCSPGRRCKECFEWSSDRVKTAQRYQLAFLEAHEARTTTSRPPSTLPAPRVSRQSGCTSTCLPPSPASVFSEPSPATEGQDPAESLASFKCEVLAAVSDLISAKFASHFNPVPPPPNPSFPASPLPPAPSQPTRGQAGASKRRPPKDDPRRIKRSRTPLVVPGSQSTPFVCSQGGTRDGEGDGEASVTHPPPSVAGDDLFGRDVASPPALSHSGLPHDDASVPSWVPQLSSRPLGITGLLASAMLLQTHQESLGPVTTPLARPHLPTFHQELRGAVTTPLASTPPPNHSPVFTASSTIKRSTPCPVAGDAIVYARTATSQPPHVVLPPRDHLPVSAASRPLTGLAGVRSVPVQATSLPSHGLETTGTGDRLSGGVLLGGRSLQDVARRHCTTPGSPHPSTSGLAPPTSSRDHGDGNSSDPSSYQALLDIFDVLFDDAIGTRDRVAGPGCPGTVSSPPRHTDLLNCAAPVQFYLDQASSTFSTAAGKGSFSAPIPSGRFSKLYRIYGKEELGQPASVNPSLLSALQPDSREPHITLSHGDVLRLEKLIARSHDAINFSYWCLGALHLLAERNLPTQISSTEERVFKSARLALHDICRDTTYAHAQVRAWRREAYLSCLRPSFSSTQVDILRRSPIFSPLLFDEQHIQEALLSAQSSANLSLHEATLRVLTRPRPAPRDSNPDRGARSRQPRRPPASRQWKTASRPVSSSRSRDSRPGPSRSMSGSTERKSTRGGRFFRK